MKKVTLIVMQCNAKKGHIARRIQAAQKAWNALSPMERLIFAYLWADPEVAADFLEKRGLPRSAVRGFWVTEEEAQHDARQ